MGAMGRALASSLVASDRSVTVWNRTPRPLPGASASASAAEAVAASPLVVVCVVDYAAMWSLLPDVSGRTVVNLTTATPRQAREAAAKLGPSYVDGGIMAVPRMIGGPGALVLYS